MHDVERNLESKISKLLEYFPVVLILGVRQSGKTFLAKKIRPNWKYFDLEKMTDYNLISSDYDFFFREYPEQVIIDEAQLLPELFSALRGVIDNDRSKKNRFILTGSSSLELIKNVSESLAGRVGLVELGTFKINEYAGQPISDFYQIFNRELSVDSVTQLKTLKAKISHDTVMKVFLKG